MNHGHFLVNGERVNIPSYLLRPGDTVEVAPGGREAGAIVRRMRSTGGRRAPEWLRVDPAAMTRAA